MLVRYVGPAAFDIVLEDLPDEIGNGYLSLAFGSVFQTCVCIRAMLLRFMPSELVAPAALALIGSLIPESVVIVVVAVLGTTAGQFLLFCLVRRAGREYVFQKRWVPVTESRLKRFDGWFDRWGGLAVAASNTMLFVRGLVTIPAGLSEMSGRTFIVLSAIGSLSFQSLLGALYLLSGHLLA